MRSELTLEPANGPAWRPRRAVGWRALGGIALGVGLAATSGLVLLKLAEAETKWAGFVTAGILLVLGALLTDVRRALLAYFVLALSVDAHYYLTAPPPPMYTGDTSPGALSIPLAVVPAIFLLALRVIMVHAGGSRFRFIPALSKPTLAVIATTAAASLLSQMWFVGLCVVWQLCGLFLLFIVAGNETRTDRDVNLAAKILMVVLLGQCVVFLLQLVTGVKFNAVGRVLVSEDVWHQATGTAAITTAGFATFMQPLVALAYAKFRTATARRQRMAYGGLAALGALVIVLTLNRSSLAGLPIGLIATEIFLRSRGLVKGDRAIQRRMVVLGGVLFVVLLAGLVLVQSKRPTGFWDDLDQRLSLMRPGFSMIRSNPILGVGPGVYAYQLRNHAVGHEGWLYISHNDYLLMWAERGTLGLLAWLLWARAVFALTLSPAGSLSRAVIGVGAAGGFVAHLWEVFWTAGMSFPAYGVIYVLAGICARDADAGSQTGQAPRRGERRDLVTGTAA